MPIGGDILHVQLIIILCGTRRVDLLQSINLRTISRRRWRRCQEVDGDATRKRLIDGYVRKSALLPSMHVMSVCLPCVYKCRVI